MAGGWREAQAAGYPLAGVPEGATGYPGAPAERVVAKRVEGGPTVEGRVCIGCGECIAICPEGAIEVEWTDDADFLQKKMVEHAYGALQGKKAIFLSFIVDVSPGCDCYPCNDAPIVRDVGILASLDPVSIDAASADLVNNEESLPGTVIKQISRRGQDKFRAVYPAVDWNVQLDYAERLGLGERKYMLVKV